jgi:hypothetical protein
MMLVVVLVAVALIFTGCATSSDDDDSSSSNTELEGTWRTACVDSSSSGDSESHKDDYTFSGASTFTFGQTFYETADCTGTGNALDNFEAGTFTIGDAVGDAKQLVLAITYDGNAVSWKTLYTLSGSTLTMSCPSPGDDSCDDYPAAMSTGVVATKQ